MTTRFKYQWLIVTLLSTLACVAQQAATDKVSDVATNKPVSSGTVTGRVYLSDTKGPARKATVHLQPATTAQIDVPNILDQRTANGGNIVEIQARFDGSFSFNHVPAGDYYVIASCPGYVSPYLNLVLAGGQPAYANQQPVTASRKDAIEAVLKGIPRVRVEPGQSAAVDVILERGAAVSGNVSYDDGSPAAGLRVEFLFSMLEDGKETWAPAPFLMFPGTGLNTNFTDDRGNYRISGLPAGKYIVATSFDLSEFVRYISSGRGGGTSGTSNQMTALKIYSGNTPRLKDAAVVPLALGEEYVGEDLQFPLSKLHTIAGHIISAHDGHVINSGRVDLYNSDDRSFVGSAEVSMDTHGFLFNFIYDGEYTLSSSISADVDYQLLPQRPDSVLPPQYTSHVRHLYGSVSKPLHVDGDMDGVTIVAPEPTAKEAQTFKDEIEREER